MKLGQKVLLYFKRGMFWLGWLVLTGVFVLVCTLLLDVSEKAQQDEDCVLTVDDIDFNTAVKTAECNIRLYSTTITITLANFLIPTIFSFIVTLEEYSPKSQLIVDLTRNIIFRLATLFRCTIANQHSRCRGRHPKSMGSQFHDLRPH